MPTAEDWIHNPLEIIDRYFDETASAECYIAKVKDHFSKKIADKHALSQVPSLNATSMDHICSGTLVRFRCMVQDMYDPEFFLGTYTIRDVHSSEEKLASGMFRDLADCKPHQEILPQAARNVTCDRQTLYCVPVPGENSWVKEAFAADCPQSAIASTSNTCQRQSKRALDDESNADTESATDAGERLADCEKTETSDVDENTNESKRSRTDVSCNSSPSRGHNLNFPLPDEKGPACIVKVYDGRESFKVNDVVEFVGILSNEPTTVIFPEKDGQVEAMEGVEEIDAHSPPPSLVPRLHCILARPLRHINPLLPPEFPQQTDSEVLQNFQKEAVAVREEIIAVLEQGLMGDTLAAEYLLCNLISSVYARHDVAAVGKFALNLSRCPSNSKFPSLLYDLLQTLVTKSFHLPLTLANLNSLRLVPKKDYTANRLVSGLLQLSDRTHLLVDETALQQGQLNTNGVNNITALSSMLSWQKVEYDFEFHKQEFTSDICTVILSEGKSILKHDCLVALACVSTADELDRRYKALDTYLTPALLKRLRFFLGYVQLLPYQLSDEMQKVIEQHFVDVRREDKQNMSVDDFYSLLVVARLLTLSYGQTELTQQIWDKAKALDAERKLRLAV